MKLPALPPALLVLVLAACDPALVKPPLLLDGGSFDAPRAGGSGGAPAPTAGSGGGAVAGTGGSGGAGGAPDARPAAPPPAPPPPRPDAARPPDVGANPMPDAGGGNVELLYVTGAMPILSDTTLIDRLEDDGFDVVTRTDLAVRAADVEGKGAVLLSGSTTAANVMMNLGNAPTLATPIVAMDENLEPFLNLTAAPDTDHGTTDGTQITILGDANPDLSAGLQGNVTVFNVVFDVSWGVPGPGALKVATVLNNANQVAIFAYPKGAMMANGQTAPAKRVFFFVRDSPTANLLTDDALDLFSAAVEFAIDP
jgi:hypothetical protein